MLCMRTVEKIAKLEVCSLAKLFISSVMLCHTKTNRGSGSHRVKNLDTENCSTFQKMMQNFCFSHTKEIAAITPSTQKVEFLGI